MKIEIPNRFETLLENEKFNAVTTLVPVENDMKSFDLLYNISEVQQSGLLSIVSGETGIGKTSSIYSTPVFLKDKYDSIVSVPFHIQYRDLFKWINENMPLC